LASIFVVLLFFFFSFFFLILFFVPPKPSIQLCGLAVPQPTPDAAQ
jgi:hypothetical protein